MKRNLRPTFLFRLIVLIILAGLVIGAFILASSIGLPIIVFFVLIGIWFIGIETGLLAEIIEMLLTNKTKSSKESVNSLLFVDTEKERKRQIQEHIDNTSDNPTVR